MFRRFRAVDAPPAKDEEAAVETPAPAAIMAPLAARKKADSPEPMEEVAAFDETLEDLRGKLAQQLAASSACIETLERCRIQSTWQQMKDLKDGTLAKIAVEGEGDKNRTNAGAVKHVCEGIKESAVKRWRRIRPVDSSHDHSTCWQVTTRIVQQIPEIISPAGLKGTKAGSPRRLLPMVLLFCFFVFAFAMLRTPTSSDKAVVVLHPEANAAPALAAIHANATKPSAGQAAKPSLPGGDKHAANATAARPAAAAAAASAAASTAPAASVIAALEGQPCTPTKRGDLPNMHCSRDCDVKYKRFHCTLCKCRACSFCEGVSPS